MPPKSDDWLRLQKKIFTRWVNQKLGRKIGEPIPDIVTGLSDGKPLIMLLEVLSESEFPNWKKFKEGATQRIQKVDNCSKALDYCWAQGVEMKMKPSTENLVDGDERAILGLIWAVMLKFLKFEDDDDGPQLSFKDSLQMWVSNQVTGVAEVTNMTKSFHNGMALCALIAKFRPKLIDMSKLDPANAEANLKTAFDAAERYFGLEKYLEWEDIAKLDEKSMVVYVSEYFYGIAEQRKVDLAAKRIAKLVTFTKENDQLKSDFTEGSTKLRAHFDKVFTVLDDTTIDNTMAGAKARLALFNAYKKDDKAIIFTDSFSLESKFNHLARRLESHKRPVYQPPAKCSIPEIRASLADMEKKEKERNVALHKELNRQIKLAQIYTNYGKNLDAVKGWIAEKKAYLEKKEEILSVGAANFALNSLSAYNEEYALLRKNTIDEMTAMAKELLDEKFEFSADVTAAEDLIKAGTTELEGLAAQKKLVHEDDLAREEFKAKVRGWNGTHISKQSKLEAFIVDKKASFATKETVTCIADAELHLSFLEGYMKDQVSQSINIEPLKKIGADILGAKYSTDLSQWSIEEPEKVTAREDFVTTSWTELEAASAAKKEVLEDDLAREKFREMLRQKNEAHKDKHAALSQWIEKSKVYVDTKESVDSVADAQDNLAKMRSYLIDQKEQSDNSVVSLKALGQEILTAEYKTKHSEYKFATPDEIAEREGFVTTSFEYLVATSTQKNLVLEDDLAREEFRYKVGTLWDKQHEDKHAKLSAWIAENKAYLEKKDEVDSIPEAQANLVTLAAYEDDKADVTKIQVASFSALTKDILEAKYETSLSNWVHPNPASINERQGFVDTSWTTLDSLRDAKKAVLDEDLKRELRKEELRLAFAKTAGDFTRYSKDTVRDAAHTHFGFVLEEVEAFAATLAGIDAEVTKRAGESKASYDASYAEATSLGVRHAENPYTKITPDELAASQTALTEALTVRKAAFDKELERQREDDRLCREMASAVDPFVKTIETNKNTITEAKAEDMEKTLEETQGFIKAAEGNATILVNIKATQEQIDGRGILYNRHTLTSALDAEVQSTQYDVFLKSKATAFQEEIDHKKLRGVTVQQYEEMKQQFDTFDKDKSGFLDKREFKACLYSMGEERGKKEVQAILDKLGEKSGDQVKMSYNGYKEFMIEQLGDTDTLEEIVTGFLLINRGKDTCDDALMKEVLEDEPREFIASTHKDDYKGWSESVFAR